MADSICGGTGYADYGFTSYSECYDTYMQSAPFVVGGDGSGYWRELPGDSAYRWAFCGRIKCY